jgi:hypothetical protein
MLPVILLPCPARGRRVLRRRSLGNTLRRCGFGRARTGRATALNEKLLAHPSVSFGDADSHPSWACLDVRESLRQKGVNPSDRAVPPDRIAALACNLSRQRGAHDGFGRARMVIHSALILPLPPDNMQVEHAFGRVPHNIAAGLPDMAGCARPRRVCVAYPARFQLHRQSPGQCGLHSLCATLRECHIWQGCRWRPSPV